MAPNPYLIMAGIGTAVSVLGSMSAAKAAKRQAALQRRQLQAQIEGAQVAALQQHNERISNLNSLISTNNAILGATGRDFDRSYKRIIEKAKKDATTDTLRISLQRANQIAQSSLQGNLITLQAQNRANAYRFRALGSALTGALNAYPLMPNSSSGPDYRYVGMD